MKLFTLTAFLVFGALANAGPISPDCPATVATHCLKTADMTTFNTALVTAGNGFIGAGFGATSTRFSPILVNNSAVQAPVGGNIICWAQKVQGYGAGAIGFQLVYSDDLASSDDTALTNPIYQTGASAGVTVALTSTSIGNIAAGETYLGFSGFKVLSSKYLSIQGAGAAVNGTVWCKVYSN